METPTDDASHDASKSPSIIDEKRPLVDIKNDTMPQETVQETSQTIPATELPLKPTTTDTQQDIATQILEFISDASTGVIAGISGAVSVVLYLMLGRIGLVLIGALAGVTLYTHFQSQAGGRKRHNESTDQLLTRILDWRDTQNASSKDSVEGEAEEDDKNDFSDFRPETAAALSEIVEAIIDGYVKWWYFPILPGELRFPREARKTLVSFLRSISWRLTRKRPADAFLDFLTNTTSIVIVFFGELSNAIKESSEIEVAPENAVRLYLTDHPDSNLAHIMDEKQQQKKFELIADDLLSNFIDKSVYDCAPAKTFLQQILSGVVLEMSLATMSKPEWLNGWIVYLLEEGEPNLVQAIDAGISGESNAAAKVAPVGPKSGAGEVKLGHQRNVTKADLEMDEAMQEARRLSQLIAEEDMRRLKESVATSPPIPEEEFAPALPERPLKPAQQADNTPDATINGSEEASILSSRSSIHETASTSDTKSPPTSFDQMSLPAPSPAIDEPSNRQSMPPLSLHNANITIMDDSDPSDKTRLRSKPTTDYLVQIEPQSSRHPGWMIIRTYSDFETLHEVLKRIAAVSGAQGFNKNWERLPPWKGETKMNVRTGLENYLLSACHYQPLADSVGLKRFLEKEHQGPTGKGQGIGWPSPAAFETMGKGLVDNLMTVGKGAADGGKSVFGGVTNVFNRNRSASKVSLSSQNQKASRSSLSISGWGSDEKKSTDSPPPLLESAVESIMSAPNEPEPSTAKTSLDHDPAIPTPAPVHTAAPIGDISGSAAPPHPPTTAQMDGTSDEAINDVVDDFIDTPTEEKPAEPVNIDTLLLPPPPSDIPDDYGVAGAASKIPAAGIPHPPAAEVPRTSTSTVASIPAPSEQPFDAATNPKGKREVQPFKEEETRVALELLFATINELYTLSSAWGLRRTLLTAAKTFLLRPGNPSLVAITEMIQQSVIEANTSDAGIAHHLRTIRSNSLPTEDETREWKESGQGEMAEWEKEKLRVKARKMLMERGVPPALRGVMGGVATGEALGVVFDSLQDGGVLRGLMFGVLLQGVRVLTH